MYWHLTLSSQGRMPLFPRRPHLLAVVRAVLSYRATVLLFCAVDDHLHLLTEGDRPGYLAGDLQRHLFFERRVQPPHFKPVTERRHLLSLVDYLLRQPARHHLDTPPCLWEGSSFLDLAGARQVGFDRRPLERALPRLHHRDFLTPVGLSRLPEPAAWEQLEREGIGTLVQAVEVASALDSLCGPRTAVRVQARSALAWMAHRAGISAGRTAEALGRSERSVRRLRRGEEEPPFSLAARRYLGLVSASSATR